MRTEETAETTAPAVDPIDEARQSPPLKKAWIYTKLSGPGWLQGAITLGGGSLAGALYIGVLGGWDLLWVQPVAMILGVIMLCAISYVTLSTQMRPLYAVNTYVSPVLGIAWLIATIIANHVWCVAQYALGTAAIQQNLLPRLGGDPWQWAIGVVLFVGSAIVVAFYERGLRGVKVVEIILQLMVGVIVFAFIGVVIALSVQGQLPWGRIFAGFIPNPVTAIEPSRDLANVLRQTGDYAGFWSERISARQRDNVLAAFGAAVGINMTFLLPYSLLKKKWGPKHRGLAVFDLSIGLIVPFFLATSCLVIAAASMFHAQADDVLANDGTVTPAVAHDYYGQLEARAGAEGMPLPADADEKHAVLDELPLADRQAAAMLVSRDAFSLANALEPLTGSAIAQYVFGIGVFGMALSTIIVLMLMNSFAVSEMFGRPDDVRIRFLGALTPSLLGVFTPLVWVGQAKLQLIIYASVIGGSLIPIAYFTFLLMMNSKRLLGDSRPRGGRRMWWNTLMVLSTAVATIGTVWGLLGRTNPSPIPGVNWGELGIGLLALLFVVGLLGFIINERKPASVAER